MAGGSVQQIRGGDDEQRGDDLVLHEPLAAEQPRPGIDQEKSDRLAVEDVDIGQRPVQHPVADQQIELLVEAHDRVPERHRARGDGGEGDQQEDNTRTRPNAAHRRP